MALQLPEDLSCLFNGVNGVAALGWSEVSDTQVFLLCLFFCLFCFFFYFWSPAACRVFAEDYEIDAERGEGRIGGGAGNCESSTCSSTDPSKTETNDAKKKHLVKLK